MDKEKEHMSRLKDAVEMKVGRNGTSEYLKYRVFQKIEKKRVLHTEKEFLFYI